MANRTTDANADLNNAIDSLVKRRPSLWTKSACGVTRSGREILVLVDRDAYIPSSSRARILLVCGLSGKPEDVEQALGLLDMFAAAGQKFASGIALSAIPCGNPDGLELGAGNGNGVGGDPSTGYPPQGGFFFNATDAEKRYLWRWICFQAPDLVLELVTSRRIRWEANEAAKRLAPAVAARSMGNGGSLLSALGQGMPDGLGVIPGLRLESTNQGLGSEISRLLNFIPQFSSWEPSPARRMLYARRSRSRQRVASILDSAYGHDLDPINYTQGVAISGRLRLAELGPNSKDVGSQIAVMLEEKGLLAEDPFGSQPSGANLAGVLWGPELSKARGDLRWSQLLVKVADRYQTAEAGNAPPPCDPDFRTEDMFMLGAIMGRAFAATDERRYIDMVAQFLLDARIQQSNGLFWQCRSAPFFWGRGNGFAAMGFSETLSYMPEDHPSQQRILDIFLTHMDALRGYQLASGMFPQMLGVTGSFEEFTATCMFGYAAARGLRRGWLDPSFIEPLQLAWQGVSERIDDEANVVDACASTGVQSNLQEYLDRPAVFGFDDRSGGMALWFAVELELLTQQA